MVECYSKFIPNMAQKTSAMRELLRKGKEFKWSGKCEEEFCLVKQCLNSASNLGSFDTTDESWVLTDVSSKGLGMVLMQKKNGVERTVLFVPRGLRGVECYSVMEKEALAVYWSVRKLRKFFFGRKFLIKTDHKPLREVFCKKGIDLVSHRIGKWVVALQEFDFEVVSIPGIDNVLADCQRW
ncbi:hypothetical protein NDU88_006652 [Pleurodeles waltl]|uniref:Reverse transcriptase RNase H-like domain-containing protein n=1 Tax=Pleurodeles waltl TaxID=8319 RepID=A0AAV7TY76_PLEWA|nr:hypothetical protein NDU88_006652 [Pleurodeles waltl]